MAEPAFDLAGKRVWVSGHRGMVGSAVVRRLAEEPIKELITIGSDKLDLRRQDPTERFVADSRPDLIILAAATVGGIHANRSKHATFLYDNLMISSNVIEAARQQDVARVVILGSSCIYPREAPQPLREEHLLTGPLEETNEGYAVAKISALELAKMYRRQYGMDCISLMPTNLYGPGDNFDLETAHVLPALLRKVHDAKRQGADTITVWGSGKPRREFLHVDDLADGVVFTAQHYGGDSHLNIGVGQDISIADLVGVIAGVVGWNGDIQYDSSMPDGTPRKLLDVSRLTGLGWRASIGLHEGVADTYEWFQQRAATSAR